MSRIKEILVEKTSTLQLDTAVQNAREEWRQAIKEMDYIDGDLAEYAIFKINAAERRYIALLTAWPDTAFSSVQEICEEICSTEIKNATAL